MSRRDDSTMYLFEEFNKPNPKPKSTASNEAPKTKPREYTKPKPSYTYEEYLKLHCGNHEAAYYWWHKQMQRIEEEKQRMCQ